MKEFFSNLFRNPSSPNNNAQKNTNQTVAPSESRFVTVTHTPTASKSQSKNNTAVLQGNFYEPQLVIMSKYRDLETPKTIQMKINALKERMNEYSTGCFLDDTFWYTSLKNRKAYCETAQPASLESVPESITYLTHEQLKWYLYWRKETVNNVFLDTDDAYVMLFVYELMNYTFNDSAAFNLSMLHRLRQKYTNLSNNIASIMYDMLMELEAFSLAEGYQEFRSSKYTVKETKTGPFNKIFSNEDLKSVSMTVWMPYLHNTNGDFFAENKKTIYKVFKKILDVFQKYCIENEIDLKNRWFEENAAPQLVPLFADGYTAYQRSGVLIEQAVFVPTMQFKDDIRSLSMLAEYIACTDQGISPFPKGFLDYLIAAEAPAKKVPSKNKKKSKSVTANMTTETTNLAENLISSQPIQFDHDKISQLSQETLSDSLSSPSIEQPNEEETVILSQEKMPDLTAAEQQFLALFNNNQANTTMVNDFCMQNRIMPALMIKQINSKFEDILNEPLVILTDNSYVLTQQIKLG